MQGSGSCAAVVLSCACFVLARGPASAQESGGSSAVRVCLEWDAQARATVRSIGKGAAAASDQDLVATFSKRVAGSEGTEKTPPTVLLDPSGDVPWKDVIHVMDLCTQVGIERLEFTFPSEVRVFLRRDAAGKQTIRRVERHARAASDEDLKACLAEELARCTKDGEAHPPVVIDTSREVPDTDVLRAMDLCIEAGLKPVSFYFPAEESPGGVEELPKDLARLTINVYHRHRSAEFSCLLADARECCRLPWHWLVDVRGRNCGPEGLRTLLDAAASALRKDPKAPHVSELQVRIQADETAPYGRVVEILRACADAGIYKIDAASARPAKDREDGK